MLRKIPTKAGKVEVKVAVDQNAKVVDFRWLERNLVDLWISQSLRCFGCKRRTYSTELKCKAHEKITGACLTPSVRHGGDQHGYHSILKRCAIPSGQQPTGDNFSLQQTLTSGIVSCCAAECQEKIKPVCQAVIAAKGNFMKANFNMQSYFFSQKSKIINGCFVFCDRQPFDGTKLM